VVWVGEQLVFMAVAPFEDKLAEPRSRSYAHLFAAAAAAVAAAEIWRLLGFAGTMARGWAMC
jgi:hypothetical protein